MAPQWVKWTPRSLWGTFCVLVLGLIVALVHPTFFCCRLVRRERVKRTIALCSFWWLKNLEYREQRNLACVMRNGACHSKPTKFVSYSYNKYSRYKNDIYVIAFVDSAGVSQVLLHKQRKQAYRTQFVLNHSSHNFTFFTHINVWFCQVSL